MKALIVFLTVFLISASSKAQSTDDDFRKMVDSAIVIQITRQDRTIYQPSIYLIDAKDEPYILKSPVHQKKFDYLNVYDKKNRTIIKKGIRAWKVIPVLNNNKLVINIIDFRITYNKNNYAFANGGGATVIFEYSCNDGKWKFVKTQWSGI